MGVVPEVPLVDPVVPVVPDLIILLGAVAVGIIIWVQEVQVLWITEVLSEALEETSIEAVQVVLVLGVVIAVVTKTNVGGSKQDKIDLTSYFRYFNSIHEFNQQLLSMIHQFPASFWKNLHFILFFSFSLCVLQSTLQYYMLLFVKKICSTSIVIEPKPQY